MCKTAAPFLNCRAFGKGPLNAMVSKIVCNHDDDIGTDGLEVSRKNGGNGGDEQEEALLKHPESGTEAPILNHLLYSSRCPLEVSKKHLGQIRAESG
jgi:hypothetical protein